MILTELFRRHQHGDQKHGQPVDKFKYKCKKFFKIFLYGISTLYSIEKSCMQIWINVN
jgi:hypothetical protein